jgi:hypothetical protein
MWMISFCLPLLFLPSFYPALSYLGAVGLFLGLVPWAVRRGRLGYFTRHTPLTITFVLLIISGGLSLYLAQLPQYGMARLWVLVVSVFFYYTLLNNASEKYLRGYLMFLTTLGVIVSLFVMTQLPWLTEYPWGDKIHSILQS